MLIRNFISTIKNYFSMSFPLVYIFIIFIMDCSSIIEILKKRILSENPTINYKYNDYVISSVLSNWITRDLHFYYLEISNLKEKFMLLQLHNVNSNRNTITKYVNTIKKYGRNTKDYARITF